MPPYAYSMGYSLHIIYSISECVSFKYAIAGDILKIIIHFFLYETWNVQIWIKSFKGYIDMPFIHVNYWK